MDFLSTNLSEHNVGGLPREQAEQICEKAKFKMAAGDQFWIWLICNFWNTNPNLIVQYLIFDQINDDKFIKMVIEGQLKMKTKMTVI